LKLTVKSYSTYTRSNQEATGPKRTKTPIKLNFNQSEYMCTEKKMQKNKSEKRWNQVQRHQIALKCVRSLDLSPTSTHLPSEFWQARQAALKEYCILMGADDVAVFNAFDPSRRKPYFRQMSTTLAFCSKGTVRGKCFLLEYISDWNRI